jgi:hypothetical protein
MKPGDESLSGIERRRFPRYRVRLSIQFRRGEAQVAGEIFNISRSGCLLVTPVLMKVGERIEASLPLPGAPPLVFTVVRTRALAGWGWYAVSADFEPHLPDDELLVRLSNEEGPQEDPDQLF